MRIVCESCGTKYSISDEKVRGKLFKIRCKKCSHVIVVRGVEDAAAEEQPSLPEPSAAGASGGMEWFYVVDGQQAGPISAEEVPAYVAAGSIQADTYMWREGMDDWIHLSEMPEFSHLVEDALAASSPGPSTDEHDTGANGAALGGHVFAGSGHVEDFPDYSDEGEATRVMASGSEEVRLAEEPVRPSFGSVDIAPPPGARGSLGLSGAGAGVSGGEGRGLAGDIFAEAGGGRGSAKMAASAGLFSADVLSSSQSTPAKKGDAALTGARSENSVLFSLDSLTSAEGPAESGNGSALPTTEGSGLIDIKALAASQASSGMSEGRASSDDHHAALSPAVMPIGQRQSHTLLYVLIGAGALVIVGLVVAIVIVLGNRGTDETTTATPTTTPAVAPETTPANTPTEPTAPAQPTADQVANAVTPELATPPAPTGPTLEQITQTTRNSATVALQMSSQAQAAATAIAGRRPVASNGSRRDSERREERETPRESEQASNTPPEREETSRTSGDRTRRDREEPASDDPVAAALARIRTDEEPERETPTNDEPERQEEPEDQGSARTDLPEQLSRSQVSQTVRRYQRRLAECRGQSSLPAGEVLAVDVDMTVQSNGRVASARSGSSDPAASCIVDVVRDMSFDEFSGEAMSFTYPVRIR